jgi:hypothetical protein
MTASTKRRARRSAAQQGPAREPAQQPAEGIHGCVLCKHVSDDLDVVADFGNGDSLPYWLCTDHGECLDRRRRARGEPPADTEEQPQPEAAAAEETAEVSQ